MRLELGLLRAGALGLLKCRIGALLPSRSRAGWLLHPWSLAHSPADAITFPLKIRQKLSDAQKVA